MPDQKRRKNFLYPRPKEGTDPTEQREFPYLPEAVNASFVIGGCRSCPSERGHSHTGPGTGAR